MTERIDNERIRSEGLPQESASSSPAQPPPDAAPNLSPTQGFPEDDLESPNASRESDPPAAGSKKKESERDSKKSIGGSQR